MGYFDDQLDPQRTSQGVINGGPAAPPPTPEPYQAPDTFGGVHPGMVQPQPIPATTQAEISAAVKERQAEIDATMFATPSF